MKILTDNALKFFAFRRDLKMDCFDRLTINSTVALEILTNILTKIDKRKLNYDRNKR